METRSRLLPRFLCDEMLGHLCRYLRAAGYDTLLACNGEADAELLEQCHREQRLFLTQDKLVQEHKAAQRIAIILPHAPLDQLAMQLGAMLRLDWLKHAFSRCLLDNTLLQAADESIKGRAPADILGNGEDILHCPHCDHIYWRGSHYKRMHARLARWQSARLSSPDNGPADTP